MHVFAWCMLAEALEPTGNFFLKKYLSVFLCLHVSRSFYLCQDVVAGNSRGACLGVQS